MRVTVTISAEYTDQDGEALHQTLSIPVTWDAPEPGATHTYIDDALDLAYERAEHTIRRARSSTPIRLLELVSLVYLTDDAPNT